MLTSLATVSLLGLLFSYIFRKLKLPSLIGMLLAGVIIGPYALNLLAPSLLDISNELRQMALVIILIRAGLALDLEDLKKVGRPAILMSFVPALLEIATITLIAPSLLGISTIEAALLGSVVAAVSPAIIVPKMLTMIEKGVGTKKGIPQMIMASGSVDDLFVIILFSAFLSLSLGGEVNLDSFTSIPISVITGLVIGIILGYILSLFFKKAHIRDSVKLLIILSLSFLLIALEEQVKEIVPFSGLLAIMVMSASIFKFHNVLAKRISPKFSKLWIAAEIMLFVLVGTTVDVSYVVTAGIPVVIIILIALLFRVLGVYICMIKTKLTLREKLFCMLAYIPKATVQAAIGSIPLAMGLPSGKIIITVAVLSILITAPLGAILIEKCQGLLTPNHNPHE